jgi:hypothetical protein
MIRNYENSDFETICSWWRAAGEPPPLPGMMVEDGTFILERNHKPILSLTVMITQSNIAYFEGYIAAPGVSRLPSDGLSLWNHCFDYAKRCECKHVILYAGKEALVRRYQELGAVPALSGLTALVRNL